MIPFVFIGKISVPETNTIKDLGVYISHNLNFSIHIDKIIAKANRMSALIFKSFKCRDTKFLVHMYEVFVRPMLEYNTTVWSPYSFVDIKRIERVQRSFTKRVPGLHDTPYLDRLANLKLERLELRRVRYDLCMAFSIIKRLNSLNFSDFFSFATASQATRSHSRNSYLLHAPSPRIDVRKNSFSVRVVKYWNFLSDDVVSAKSLSCFKLRLAKVCLDSLCKVNYF